MAMAAAKNTIDVRLSALDATPLESRRPICSLAPTRLEISPAWRWVKNSTGSAMTCQRKRLTITTESLVCSLSSSDWRTSVSSARTSAVRPMPISSGMNQLPVCWIRMLSMKICEKPAATIAGTTSARLTSTSRATGAFDERNSRSSSFNPSGLMPDRWNSAVGSIVSATPVKARSSSTMSVRRRPTAGSLM